MYVTAGALGYIPLRRFELNDSHKRQDITFCLPTDLTVSSSAPFHPPVRQWTKATKKGLIVIHSHTFLCGAGRGKAVLNPVIIVSPSQLVSGRTPALRSRASRTDTHTHTHTHTRTHARTHWNVTLEEAASILGNIYRSVIQWRLFSFLHFIERRNASPWSLPGEDLELVHLQRIHLIHSSFQCISFSSFVLTARADDYKLRA
jgi:hypothetical protein